MQNDSHSVTALNGFVKSVEGGDLLEFLFTDH